MKIVNAEKKDAALIGKAVVIAIGEDIAKEFAGEKPIDDVYRLFSNLAVREDSQYSYLNALKAVDEDGHVMGIIVGYDGALLHELRLAFFDEVKNVLDKDLSCMLQDECEPWEWYLDTLAVFEPYRRQGVASALLIAMSERAKAAGKPAGLLCDKTNHRAHRLYEQSGFRLLGEGPFAGVIMNHMVRGNE